MGTSGSGSTADVSDEITADTLGIASGTKIVTATSKDTSVAEVTDVVRENADVAADAVNVGQVAVAASTNASAGTYIKSFKITAVGAGSTYIDVKIIDTATSTESHKYIPVKVSSDKKLASKTAAAIKSEVTDKNPEKSPQKTEASISFVEATVDKTTTDSKFKIEVANTGNGDVTYTSSNTAVAEVAEKTGEVTIVGAGTATITATVTDSDTYTYAVKTAAYTITVTQATPSYIGSKAPSEAKALGDIVFTDGSATPYSADLTLTAEQKAAAVAVIFYAGSASDTLGAKTLGVGLVQGENLAWAQTDTNGYTNKITTLLATKTSGSNADDATFSGNGANDGSGSLAKLKGAVSDYSEANYPAWAWIEGYAATANLTGTSYESGWYIPSIGEVCALHKAKAVVNNSIQKIGGTQISAKWYWSSSQDASADINAWDVPLGSVGGFNSGFLGQGWKSDMVSVCAVRVFN